MLYYVNPAEYPREVYYAMRRAKARQRLTTTRVKARKNPRRKSMARKRRRSRKLFGAALKARNKRLAKMRRKRMRRNPAAWRISTKMSGVARRKAAARAAARRAVGAVPPGASWAKVVAAYKKKPKRKYKRKGYTAAKKLYRGKRKYKKSKKTKRKSKGKKTMAGKKKGRKSKSKKGKYKSKKTKHTKKKKGKRSRKLKMSRKARARRRAYARRGLSTLKRARRIIKNKRRYGKAVRRYIAQRHFRVNPLGGMVDAVKAVVPTAIAFFAGRVVSNKLVSIPAVGGLVGRLGQHAPVATAAAMLALGAYAHKVPVVGKFVARHKAAVMTGLGLNFVFTAISAYMPASVKGMIGAGDSGVYDQALMQDMGEYLETGEYIETGLYEELGLEQDLGAMEAPVPKVSMLKQLPSRSMTSTVPQWTPADDADSAVYDGIFAGGGKGWGY